MSTHGGAAISTGCRRSASTVRPTENRVVPKRPGTVLSGNTHPHRRTPPRRHSGDRTVIPSAYPSLAAWILDRLRDEGGLGLRQRRILIGHLGRIGGEVAAHARRERIDRPNEHVPLLALATRIVALQQDIMKGGDHAGEEDREPALEPRRPG